MNNSIKNIKPVINVRNFSSILSLNYAFAKIELIENINLYCSVYNENDNIIGIIFSINEFDIDVLLMCSIDELHIGQKLIVGDVFKFKFNSNMLNKVVSTTGDIILGEFSVSDLQNIKENKELDIFVDSKGMHERDDVKIPFLTGINVLDACLPVGHGQRMLVLGDRKVGKTSFCLSIIKNQCIVNHDSICVYVFISKKTRNIAQVYHDVKFNNVKNFIFVSASASMSLAEQFIAPFVGCGIAEFLACQGKNVSIIYDDLTKHARIYKEICMISGTFPGRDAFPGDIFYLHAKLLERSLQLKNLGSITAFPIIETIDGEMSDYIPTNLISITDGQVILDKEIFNSNIKPAVNIQFSVSRVGSTVQNFLIAQLTKKCKSDIVQSLELEKFYSFMDKEDIDKCARNIIIKGRLWRSIFQQDIFECETIDKQIILFYIVCYDLMIDEFNINNSSDLDLVKNKIMLKVNKIVSNINKDVSICNLKLDDLHKIFVNDRLNFEKFH